MREASIIKKRRYIEATYQVILKEGVKGIKIRTLAEMIGCNSAVLYKYFDNVDHLITLASIRFLKNYMKIFQEMNEMKNRNPIRFSEKMWKVLIEESFKYPDIYYILSLVSTAPRWGKVFMSTSNCSQRRCLRWMGIQSASFTTVTWKSGS